VQVTNYLPLKLRDLPLYEQVSQDLQWSLDNFERWYTQYETFQISSVDQSTNQISVTSERWLTGQAVRFVKELGLPSGVNDHTTYYLYFYSPSPGEKAIKIYTSYTQAILHGESGLVDLGVASGTFIIALYDVSVYGDGIQSIRDKYKNFLTLLPDTTIEIYREFGFTYITDILDLSEEEIKAFIIYGALISALKGSRKGLELIFTLLGFDPYIIYEWWELVGNYTIISQLFGVTNDTHFLTNYQPINTVCTDPYTWALRVYINEEKTTNLTTSTLKIKEFCRNYVYPLLVKFDVIGFFTDVWNKLVEEYYNSTLEDVEFPPFESRDVLEAIFFTNRITHRSNNGYWEDTIVHHPAVYGSYTITTPIPIGYYTNQVYFITNNYWDYPNCAITNQLLDTRTDTYSYIITPAWDETIPVWHDENSTKFHATYGVSFRCLRKYLDDQIEIYPDGILQFCPPGSYSNIRFNSNDLGYMTNFASTQEYYEPAYSYSIPIDPEPWENRYLSIYG